jgi:hypothetical protein
VIDARIEHETTTAQLRAVSRHLPFALAQALTDAAKAGREATRDLMRNVFDRPTPFTLNAFQVWPATKTNLQAAIEVQSLVGTGMTRHYLAVQAEGGQRSIKRGEALLQRRFNQYSIGAVVPTRRAQRDAYGNWSRGEVQRVLSNLQAQYDYAQNTTARSRRRNPRRVEYFVPDGLDYDYSLPPAIYRRRGPNGKSELVAIFLSAPPSYTPRFPWKQVALARIRRELTTALDRRLLAAIVRFGG